MSMTLVNGVWVKGKIVTAKPQKEKAIKTASKPARTTKYKKPSDDFTLTVHPVYGVVSGDYRKQ